MDAWTGNVRYAVRVLLRTPGFTLIEELEPLRAVYGVAPLAQRIGNEYADDRLRTSALALLAGTAPLAALLPAWRASRVEPMKVL